LSIKPQESYGSPLIDVSIIAVHGLGGDSYNTWTDSESGKLWLRDLLPLSKGFGNARIMTFGYDARPWLKPGNKTSARSFTFAESLLADIRSMRTTTNTRGKPIMFIGHSLGGIVVKRVSRRISAACMSSLTDNLVATGFGQCTAEFNELQGHLRINEKHHLLRNTTSRNKRD
jgi:pimeloyl-ACP methyl ester carboxylesterase